MCISTRIIGNRQKSNSQELPNSFQLFVLTLPRLLLKISAPNMSYLKTTTRIRPSRPSSRSRGDSLRNSRYEQRKGLVCNPPHTSHSLSAAGKGQTFLPI